MEHLGLAMEFPGKPFIHRPFPILAVPNDRMPRRRKLDAYLMGTPGDKLHFQKGRRPLLPQPVICLRGRCCLDDFAAGGILPGNGSQVAFPVL